MLANARTLFESGFDIVNALATTATTDFDTDVTGDRINLENWERAYLLILKEAGDAGEDLAIALQQHDAASSGNSKALTFTKLWIKKGASLATVGTWTAYELSTASSDLELDSVNGADLATDTTEAMILVEVLADSLDGANGYTFVSYNNEGDDVGSALECAAVWILMGNRYPQAAPLTSLA